MHCGSDLNPLLLTIVLEISREIFGLIWLGNCCMQMIWLQ